MFPGFDEVVIKQNFPLRMHDLLVTKGHECVTCSSLAPWLEIGDILEGIWKLWWWCVSERDSACTNGESTFWK
jgi:hypothetical protein